jgi:hypothetical protein
MRAQEFLPQQQTAPVTISIPISITIPQGGGMPVIGSIAAPAGTQLPPEPVMVPPLQQQIELAKQQGGKSSPIINQILATDPVADQKETPESAEPETQVRRNFWNLNEDYQILEDIFDRTSE